MSDAHAAELDQHEAEILEVLDRDVAILISSTRWEKHLVRGVVALVGEVTTDQSVARRWVKALGAADSGDEGAA